jgi:hypothetical protein
MRLMEGYIWPLGRYHLSINLDDTSFYTMFIALSENNIRILISYKFIAKFYNNLILLIALKVKQNSNEM